MMSIRSAIVAGLILWSGAAAQQQPVQAVGTIFKSETRLVPVDVVVQDKKGNYVHDLEQKDFKVWEDNKEQQIRAFSFEADPASPRANEKRYLVLFFDASSMSLGDQMQARQSAAKFIDANAGPNRLMAVVNFGGSLQVAQNFTDDIERLKAVVAGAKVSSVSTAAGSGRGLGGLRQFGMRSMVTALREMAKLLGDIPGRKSLVLFSAGFPLTQEIFSEVTATIDACNRANVAVYPVDVRGLTMNSMPFDPRRGAVTTPGMLRNTGLAAAAWPVSRIGALFQRGGTPPGAGGGTTAPTGGGTGSPSGGSSAPIGRGDSGMPSRSGAPSGGFGGSRNSGSEVGGAPGGRGFGGNNPGVGRSDGTAGGRGGGGADPRDMNRNRLPNEGMRQIVPRIPESATTNQQLLYMLADGTGGFVIANTNDLLGGLQKIGKDQNEYYLLAYNPPDSEEGSCHTIRVKVNRGGTNVRARSGYCNAKKPDLLSGKPAEKELETIAAGTQAPTLKTEGMQIPFFYTAANTARVYVAMDIPTSTLKFEKVKGKQRVEINVMGIAYRPDGNVAAKFTDVVKKEFEEKKQAEEFLKKPLHYDNQFDLGSGEYTLKVVFSSAGAGFGKVESPLKIDPYDPAKFHISALALTSNYHRVTAETNLDTQLVEGKTPLMAGALQFEPNGLARFKNTENVAVYFEVYEPAMGEDPAPAQPVKMGGIVRIVDPMNGAVKVDSGAVELTNFLRKGNPVAPVGLKVPIQGLAAGVYRVEVEVGDSLERALKRTAVFEIQ